MIGWFNKEFIKSGKMDKSLGAILRNAYKNRTDGDYAPFIEFSIDDVEEMHESMKIFIQSIKELLAK